MLVFFDPLKFYAAVRARSNWLYCLAVRLGGGACVEHQHDKQEVRVSKSLSRNSRKVKAALSRVKHEQQSLRAEVRAYLEQS